MKQEIRKTNRIALKREYVSVYHDGDCSYGGNQNWFSGMMKRCGCGIVSAADVLWYLKSSTRGLDFERYKQYVHKTGKSFITIPYHGMPGFCMGFFLNIRLIRSRMNYRARWGVLPGNLENAIKEMLSEDIPVPFCIGPVFYQLPKRTGIRLYERRSSSADTEDEYIWTKSVRNHFMTMTGIDGDWIRVSSWGEEYYISLEEFKQIVMFEGFGLFSNIIYIQKK